MIFSSFDEIKPYIAANISNQIETIMPYLNMAVRYVTPFLSQAQWEKLDQDYKDGSTDEAYEKLLAKVQPCLVDFAYLIFKDDGAIEMSDMGLTRIETDNHKSAYEWMTLAFAKRRTDNAWWGIQDLIVFLQANKVTYNLWASSEEYDYLKSLFLWNVNLFAKVRPIESMNVLWSLRSAMTHVQEDMIRKNLGDEFYEELLGESASGSFSVDNKKILRLLYRSVANLSISRGLAEGVFTFNENGLTLQNIRTTRESLTVSDKQMDWYKCDAENNGQAALKELKNFLNANASNTKYAAYFNSDQYDDPSDGDNTVFQNKQGGTYIAR